MLLRDYPKAEKAYERILRRDKRDEFYDVRLDYAKAMKAQGKYKMAMDELSAFISTIDSDSLRAEASLELRGILGLENYPENNEVSISFAGEEVNSPSAESSPAIYTDGSLYFSSMKSKTPVTIDGEEGEYHAKIYVSTRTPEGDFGKASPLEEAINRIDFYNGSVSFSDDGEVMYFTREKFRNNKVESAQIYMSKRQGDKWSAPYPIEALNNEYRSLHPYEGELFGRKVLFFVSDMPGGYGGYDIYYSTMVGGEFELPVNLGPVVNTYKDEVTPFYREGTLYFSSNGHPGMGGLDIFSSAWDGSKWSTPKNMGEYYNTSYDDFFYRLNQSGTSGVLISNRTDKAKKKFKGTETCCDDIYMIQIRDIVINLKILVSNDDGPLEGAVVELLEGDNKVPVLTKTNELSNDFNIPLDPNKSYTVYVDRDGYNRDTITMNTIGIFDDYTTSKEIVLVRKPKATRKVSRNEPIVLKSIYFDFDKYDILPEAEKDLGYLKSLMDKYPDLRIELSAHTDSRGNDKYNLKLSQQRAESTKDWLVEKGITSSRIVAKGYGETKLLNKCKNGVDCSEEEHQMNRRSEFKIISGPTTIEIEVED